MIPRKKKKTLIITISIIAILLIIGILIILFITTDLFKSNNTLFAKYFVQNFSQIEEISVENHLKEAEQLLENNKYTSNIEGIITYSENGKTENPINKMKLTIDSQIDKTSKYDYKDIKITNEDEKVIGVEYLDENNSKAIRLNGIKQFVTLNNGNIDKLNVSLEKMNSVKIKELLQFSEEEKNTLKNRYLNIINQKVPVSSYSKQSGTLISVNGKQIKANAYSITLTKEKFNDLLIELLEQIKADTILLDKIKNIDNTIKEIDTGTNTNFQQNFIKAINEEIENIKNSNIGQQERKITVYEQNGTTVRTVVETEEGVFNLDLVNEKNYKMIELKNSESTEKENSIAIKIDRKIEDTLDNTTFLVTTVENDIAKNMEFDFEEKIENNNLANSWILKLSSDNNELIVNINEKTTIVNNFTNQINISKDNNIYMNQLTTEQVESVQNQLNDNINKQIENLNSIITINDVYKMLINVGVLQEGAEEINTNGNITEAEKNRFNAKFEFYVGEEVTKGNIQELIQIAKDNLESVKITQYKEKKDEKDKAEPKEYKIVIKKDNKNENLANKLSSYIEEEKEEKYTVKIDYNEDNGLVENIWISLSEKK